MLSLRQVRQKQPLKQTLGIKSEQKQEHVHILTCHASSLGTRPITRANQRNQQSDQLMFHRCTVSLRLPQKFLIYLQAEYFCPVSNQYTGMPATVAL